MKSRFFPLSPIPSLSMCEWFKVGPGEMEINYQGFPHLVYGLTMTTVSCTCYWSILSEESFSPTYAQHIVLTTQLLSSLHVKLSWL